MGGEKEVLSRARKKLPLIVGLLIAAVVVALVLRAGHAPVAEATVEPTIAVKTVTLAASSVPNEVSASGTVRPIVEATIAPDNEQRGRHICA
jgi:multidrug efflux pump subunit AcrA (membrane-fusion protein)